MITGTMHRHTPVLVFALALAVRLLYLWEIQQTPLVEVLLIDSETYDRFAHLILEGRFRGEEVYAMNILYPFFLAGVYLVTAGSHLAVLILQAMLDAASCDLVFWIARRLFDSRVAVVAGVITALYGPMVFYSGALLTPTLVTLLALCATALLVRYQRNPSSFWAIGAGLVTGLAVLVRGNHLLLLPLALVFFLIVGGRGRRTFLHWGLYALVVILMSGAVTLRNRAVEGDWVPISANYAAFYIGHNDGATGLYAMPHFTRNAEFDEEVWGTSAAVSEMLGRPVSLADGSRYLFDQGLSFAVKNPGAELRLAGTKFYYFWNRTEAPTNLSYHFARDFSKLLRALPVSFGMLSSFGLLGLFLARRRWRDLFVLSMCVLVPLLTTLLFFVSAEYRLPAAPPLAIFSGFAIVRMVEWIRGKNLRNLLAAGVALGLLLAGTHVQDHLLWAQTLKRVDYLNFGTLYKKRGDLDHALVMLEQSVAIDPNYAPAYQTMAEIHENLGNEMEAAKMAQLARRFRTGDDSQPAVPGALSDRVLEVAAMYQAGEYARALAGFEQLREDAEAGGEDVLALSLENNIGLCYYKLGDFEKAERIFIAIIEAVPEYVKAYNNLGRVRVRQGRLDEAREHFERALSLDPANRIARRELDRLPESP